MSKSFGSENTVLVFTEDSASGVAVPFKSSSDALLVTSVTSSASALTYVTYSDATYTYYCEAAVGTARSTALWQVSRKTNSTGDIIYAGTGAFDQAATSLAVVGALTYTLGA
jgi:hypothetical protein